MLLRASVFLTLALGTQIGCGPKKGGRLTVDTPALPYKAPDVEELSGTADDDEPTEPAEEPKAQAPTPPPAPIAVTPTPAAPPPAVTKAPAAPAKAPAKPAGAPATPAKKP